MADHPSNQSAFLYPEEESQHPFFHRPKKCGVPLTIRFLYTGKKPNRNRLERLHRHVHRKTLNKNGWELGWAYGTQSRIGCKRNRLAYGKCGGGPKQYYPLIHMLKR